MGIVRSGVPEELVERLRLATGVATFVETGTYMGDTAAWAAERFARVVTIELSDELFAAARRRFESAANVEVVNGDSRGALRDVVATLDGPALFWLDAHWSGGPTSGEAAQCPLLDELRLLRPAETEHLILVDDARLFLSAPPPPQRVEDWPTIGEIVRILSVDGRADVAVVEDVIVSVPSAQGGVVVEYSREANTRLWQQQDDHAGGVRPALRLVRQGLGMLAHHAARRLRAAH